MEVTFSPSKSVSLLWALSSNPQIRSSVVESHEAAVATALEYLDAHATHTRTCSGGVQRTSVPTCTSCARGGTPARSGPDAITMFENGGGDHLDLMTAQHIWAGR